MADEELELDLETQPTTEDITRKDSRIKSLSDKVKTTSEERDALAKQKEEESAARVNAEKERDFFKGFAEVSTEFPGASEFQDKIWDKVKSGYSVKDATLSTMVAEGKYAPKEPKRESAAGGSAATGIHDTAEKKPADMSREELRNSLLDAESRGERLI